MTLTVRQSSVTGATTAGRALTYAEMDANWAHVIDSSNSTFTPSGTGAISTDLQTRGRLVVYANDFGSKMVSTPAADVNLAIAAVNTAGGGTVVIPASFTAEVSISVKSKVALEGRGPNMTVITAANSLNAPVIKNDDQSGGNSYIQIKNLRIEGNSANQASGDRMGIYFVVVDEYLIENVYVNDTHDWGIAITQGTYGRLVNCTSRNVVNTSHSGFLFGSSNPSNLNCDEVEVIGCVSESNGQDGFTIERGTDIRVSNCRAKSNGQTGFKVAAANNVSIVNCYSTANTNGFKVQNFNQNVVLTGNLSYRNNDSGYLFGNLDTSNISRGLVVNGNLAVENGQSPASTSYGFAFEGTTSATYDQIVCTANIAIDNQGVVTQGRGISFGANGTFSNVLLANNFCKGNTADFSFGASLQTSSFTYGPNTAISGSTSSTYSEGQSIHRLNFWADNIAAGSGTTNFSDGFSGRGYIMPKAGYVRGTYVKSNAAVTAGTLSVNARKNNSNFTSGLSVTSGTFNSREETQFAKVFAAGDYITCVYSTDAGFLPTGTADFDVVVEVVY